ncbi:MAG: FitA-like ribbon-helix-helix domain-containing protein [Acidimicrobiales bacterium]
MVMVQIRDVPDDVHRALTRQAELEGKSLNKFLLEQLRQVARIGRNRAVFERANAELRGVKRPTTTEIVETIRAAREAADGLR